MTDICPLCSKVITQDDWLHCINIEGYILLTCYKCTIFATPIPTPPQESHGSSASQEIAAPS